MPAGGATHAQNRVSQLIYSFFVELSILVMSFGVVVVRMEMLRKCLRPFKGDFAIFTPVRTAYQFDTHTEQIRSAERVGRIGVRTLCEMLRCCQRRVHGGANAKIRHLELERRLRVSCRLAHLLLGCRDSGGAADNRQPRTPPDTRRPS